MINWLDFKSIIGAVKLEPVLRRYGVALRRSGKDQYRGCCPIHRGEGRDAFHVNLTRNVLHCFACEFGDDVSGSGCQYLVHGCGVVFMLDQTGKETVLYAFTGVTDGALRRFFRAVSDHARAPGCRQTSMAPPQYKPSKALGHPETGGSKEQVSVRHRRPIPSRRTGSHKT